MTGVSEEKNGGEKLFEKKSAGATTSHSYSIQEGMSI